MTVLSEETGLDDEVREVLRSTCELAPLGYWECYFLGMTARPKNTIGKILKSLPDNSVIRLHNVTCVYCGSELTKDITTREHVIGRRFVPKGKLHGYRSFRAWARCQFDVSISCSATQYKFLMRSLISSRGKASGHRAIEAFTLLPKWLRGVRLGKSPASMPGGAACHHHCAGNDEFGLILLRKSGDLPSSS